MTGNDDFDQILSTTLKNYVPKLADNVFTARPLFYALTNGQTPNRLRNLLYFFTWMGRFLTTFAAMQFKRK